MKGTRYLYFYKYHTKKMIEAYNLNKIYYIKRKINFWSRPESISKEVIKNISMNIPEGKIIGLLGINGAGKTTTIKMLSTLLQPTSGEIFVDHVDAIKEHMQVKKMINIINGGERNIYWRLTARENLWYFGKLYGIKKSILNYRIEKCLKTVDLQDNADIVVEKFSKGMKQRLQIARGLINDPRYIFLDEPTLGLDIIIAKELRRYLKILARDENKGILLTTHYIYEAEELCDYIYVINNGVIVEEGTPEYIKQKCCIKGKLHLLMNKETIEFVRDIKNINKVIYVEEKCEGKLLDIAFSEDILEEISILAKRNNISILNISMSKPSLEESLFSMLST